MGSFKALGPDGFQPIFFKTYWEIVGNLGDCIHFMVKKAFESGTFKDELAETLIVLIPKK